MEDSQESLSPSSSLSLSSTFSSSSNPQPSSPSSSFSSSSCLSSPLNPYPLLIDAELWMMAEKRALEMLRIIQPALVSEEKRKSIINNVQMLIKDYFGIEVFPFGSVPLKTYLPDGDIDLTALSHQNLEEDLARDLCSILQDDKHDSTFLVQDVQYIPAQVKIVKCTVNNIPVDISFNQMAGLSALCFLEKVDQLIGKDHLFKHSIILIKAWCYYESRILGGHHGLISTYALEIMVLHIINMFHLSLCGPLAVLYKFLDYYSTFDWDNYCVSMNGPVALSSLPENFEETLENDGEDLLLSQEFLRHCRETFRDPIQARETSGHGFPIKHLNIVDPLKDNNNLGRCVSKGNYHRIKCALSYGAKSLLEILKLPGESMGMGLEKFFVNTLNRNGRGERQDVQIPVPAFGTGRSEASDLSGDYDSYYHSLLYGQWYHNYTLSLSSQSSPLSSPSRSNKKSAWDALRQLVRSRRNFFYGKRGDVVFPSPSLCHPYAPQVRTTTFGIGEMEKSRGTGTYIPKMTQVYRSYRDMHAWPRGMKPESSNCELLMKSPEKSNKVKDSLEKKNAGNGTCVWTVDLSPEQFPHLPTIKKPMTMRMRSHHCSQPIVNTQQEESSSSSQPSYHGIKFGTYEPSLPIKRADAGFSATTLLMTGIPTIELPEQEGLSESDEERVVVKLKPFELKDDNDFPPLCM
ncbi:hypothetical protein SLE2022_123300 [Rubroshorea leprosula]